MKEELKRVSQKDTATLKGLHDEQEIRDLKKQIRQKKHAGVIRFGHNLKVIGKNVVKVGGAVGKGLGKFVGEDPKRKGKKPRKVEEVMRDMPQ